MGEHVSVRDALKAVDAWDRWLDGNIAALLDAAEDAALYRRLRNPPPGRHEALTVCAHDEALFGELLDEAVRAAIDAERGKG